MSWKPIRDEGLAIFFLGQNGAQELETESNNSTHIVRNLLEIIS